MEKFTPNDLRRTAASHMAALGIARLPSRLVEAIIAASIAVAALYNLYPRVRVREWMIAFGFGLFHGFGFANVLNEMGLERRFMVLSLLGFNLGVELGQLAVLLEEPCGGHGGSLPERLVFESGVEGTPSL